MERCKLLERFLEEQHRKWGKFHFRSSPQENKSSLNPGPPEAKEPDSIPDSKTTEPKDFLSARR